MSTATVVGSGPNGLAAALTLAAAGVSVRVLEAADQLGGGLRTSELTEPGLLHDECAAFHPLGPASSFARDFDLAGAGLQWRWAPVELAHPLCGHSGAVMQRDVTGTAAHLGRDGAAWRRLFAPLVDTFDDLSHEILQPVGHLPQHPLTLARFGAPSALPALALARLWRDEPARALFAGVAAHAMRPLTAPLSSAIGMALATAGQADGWPVAEGGSGAIARALVQRAGEHGVRFETGVHVRDVRELDTDLVLLDTTPRAAADILGDALPAGVRRAYQRYRPAPGVFKIDLAVEGGIPWRYEPARRAGTVHLGGDTASIAAAEAAVNAGRMPIDPFVLVGQQFLADPSRSRGEMHPIYAYAHVPSGYSYDVTDVIIRQIENAAPGFRERIISVVSRSPQESAAKNANLIGGDVVGGANTLRQLVGRPRLATNPYATGVPGVYLCSASTPPGAGAHGMCGHLAATSALKRL